MAKFDQYSNVYKLVKVIILENYGTVKIGKISENRLIKKQLLKTFSKTY